MRNGEKYAGGLTLNFIDPAEFENETIGDSEKNDPIKARNLLRVLMNGWNERWTDLLSWRTFKAVFNDRDHKLTKALRHEFQQGFHHVFSQLAGKTLNQLQLNQAQLYLSNCLSYLPFADITPHESLAIPQYLDGQWQMIDYKVVPLELTPTTGFKKLFLAEQDRVFAYGLEPIHQTHADPHLIFMGTTYPAGQGFATTINTDLEAFETAGKKLYRSGHRNITRFLDKQSPKKTHVCGTSLGGALSLLVAIDQGDKLSRVDALNPPGLYHPWRKSRFDHWDEFKQKPEVYVQKQIDDPVSRYGIWKPDWNILSVVPPANRRGPNQLADHALNYAGIADSQFIGVDTHLDNEERRLRTFWHYTVLRSTAYYFGMVPFRHFVLPVVRFTLNHKIQLALMLPLFMLLILSPPLLIAVSASFAINVLLSTAIASHLLTDLLLFLVDRIQNKSNSQLSMFLNRLAGRPWLQLAVAGVALATVATVVASIFLFPAVTPLLVLTIATIPLACAVISSISNGLLTLFGYKRANTPRLHHPTLARNESLDIFRNTMEATFTYKEIGEYYRAQRCVLKNKPFLPEEKDGTPKLYKSTRLTKREVLKKSQDPSSQDTNIKIIATKAKIHDIHNTLHLIHQFGFYKEDKLRSELEKDRQHYVSGKYPEKEAPHRLISFN